MQLLDAIDAALSYPKADRHGERWIPCPFHGERRANSFSYSERGFNCFACPAHGSLRQLAAHLGIVSGIFDSPLPLVVRRPKPKPAPVARDWQRDPDVWRRFLPLPQVARDYYHRRGFSDESIERWRLGYGVLPSSRCTFPRYILPVFESGRLLMLRGRLTESPPCSGCELGQAEQCDEDKGKWLRSAGGPGNVLFGADCLTRGSTVIVAEAPYSAILAMQAYPEVRAVAPTASAGWEDAWTARIAAASPRSVLVWYDHDLHGRIYGRKVADELARAHLPVHLYRWPRGWPEKADLADVVTAGLQSSGVVA